MPSKTHLQFAKRLNEACDGNVIIPEHGKGRQVSIANKLNISQEAVRRYFEGNSRPKPGNMTRLASILNVDEGWLALGIEPTMSNREKKEYVKNIDASIYMVNALFSSNGYNCAFNEDLDSGVDFFAIRKGIQISVAVTTCLNEIGSEHGAKSIPVKSTFENHINIVVVTTSKVNRDYLVIDSDMMNNKGEQRTGSYELNITYENNSYFCQGEEITKLEDADLL